MIRMDLVVGLAVSAYAFGLGVFLLAQRGGDAFRFAGVAFSSGAYVLSLTLLFFTERFVFSHAAILSGAATLAAIFLFSISFRRQPRPWEYALALPLLGLAAADLSGAFVIGIRHGPDGIAPVHGPYAPALLLVTLGYALASLVMLYRARYRSRGRWHQQARYVFLALLVLLASILAFNVAAPLRGMADANMMTALSLLAFLAIVTYALTHRGLFSARLLLTGATAAALAPVCAALGIGAGFAFVAILRIPPSEPVLLTVAALGAAAGIAFAETIRPRSALFLQRVLGDRPTHGQEAERRMIAEIVHDLQTPLAVLRTETEGAGLEPLPRARALRAVDDLSARIRRLAEFARAGMPVRQAAEPVRLDRIVAEVAEYVGVVAAERGVRLALETNQVRVRGRRADLEALVTNLLSNALEHASRGTAPHEVFISCGSEHEHAVLKVGDTGPGMPAAERARACEPFYRAPGTRGSPGMGLGLAIARQVAVAHGGTLALDERPGGGLLATARLPELVH